MAHPQRLEDISSDDESENLPPGADDVPPEAHDNAIIAHQNPNGDTTEALLAVSVEEQKKIRTLLSKTQRELKTARAKLAKRDECTDTIKEKLITKCREEKRRLRNDLTADKEDLNRRIKKLTLSTRRNS